MTKRIPHKYLWGLFLFALISPHCIGQQRNLYSGAYKVGPYEGKAQYTYQVIGIDTVLDGAFKMERSDLEALLEKNDQSFLIDGNFTNGQPQGDWTFQFGEFYTDSTAQVSGFQYRVNVNGTLQETQGYLNQGKPEGKWNVSHKKIKDSQVLDTLFYSEITFLDGVPQQSFTIGNTDGTLIGRFLRTGLAHDTWSLFSNEADNTENWSFNNGWLEKIEKIVEGTSTEIEIFKNSSTPSRIIHLNKGYVTLISIYANSSSEAGLDLPTGINELLIQNSSSYRKIDSILSALGSKEFMGNFRVKVPYFPLDSLSRKQLDSTVKLVQGAKKISKGFLENTRLNLIKRSDEEANTLYTTIYNIDSTFLKPLGLLVELEELGITESLSEEMRSAYLFPTGMPTPQDSPNTNGQGMADYLGMAKYAYDSLEQIKTALGQKLADDKQQQEFVLLEEQMITQANALNQFPDSVRQRLGKAELKALDAIKSVTERILSAYAEMPTGDEKLNQARMLITCLLHFDALSQEIAVLPNTSQILKEKYTDAIWNPFTATIMDETVKKRITLAYNNVLLPYLLGKVENDLNCENGERLHLLFQETQKRMLELRDEDTSKLERKLRKERNPKIVLQLFNLKPLEE